MHSGNSQNELPGAISLYTSEQLEKLRNHLQIKAREEQQAAPVALRIERSREVELQWGDLHGDLDLSAVSNGYIRSYFERSWRLENATTDAAKLAEVKKWIRPAGVNGYARNLTPAEAEALNLGAAPAAGPWKFQALAEGTWVVEHRPSGRIYELLLVEGTTWRAEDLGTWNAYEKAWEQKVAAVRLVAPNDAAKAASVFSYYEEIDLGPAVIAREWRELEVREKFTAGLSTGAEGLVKKVTEGVVSPEEADALMAHYLNLKMRQGDVQEMMQRLADRAGDLGYYLHIDATVPFDPPGPIPAKDVKRGVIYRRYWRLYHWTTTETRIERVVYLHAYHHFHHHWHFIRRPVQYKKHHWEYNWDYSEVKIDWDPWVEKEEALQKSGMNVFRMARGESGYVDASGTSLEDVMLRCDQDEAFRQKCVVMLPKYEAKLTEGEILTAYGIFHRPLPGLTPIAFPQLFVHEKLGYRTSWQSSELGPLLNSINLSPDEERKITVTRSFEMTSEFKRTATSVLDLTETRSLELSSEMEREGRHEEKRTASSNWNAKAGFSFGPFSAGGGGGGSKTQTTRDFARNLQKLAQKAASSITRKTRQEISSTQSTTTKTSNIETVEFKVKNINQGRTLNLMFYQINNRFEGATELDDITWVVTPSVEIISGSGVLVPRSYSLNELPAAFFSLARMPLPLAVDTHDIAYRWALLRKLTKMVNEEYLNEIEEDDGSITATLKLKDGGEIKPFPGAGGDENALADAVGAVTEQLQTATTTGTPVQRHPIVFPSAATYLDSMLGVLPATEPYAEEMRLQEARHKAATVYKEYARGMYDEAKARYLFGMNGFGMPDQSKQLRLIEVDPTTASPNLILILSHPLPAGDWQFEHDAGMKYHLSEWHHDRRALVIPCTLGDGVSKDGVAYRIRLIELKSKQTVVFDPTLL
jgi:hypothetical protein